MRAAIIGESLDVRYKGHLDPHDEGIVCRLIDELFDRRGKQVVRVMEENIAATHD
jgi:hypothetical protein